MGEKMLASGFCGKCDYENMLARVEASIASGYMYKFPQDVHYFPFCPTCGTQVSIPDAEEYYQQNISSIPMNLEDAIRDLQIAKGWWKNVNYVKSRLFICKQAVAYIMRSALETLDNSDHQDANQYEYAHEAVMYNHYRLMVITKAINDLSQLLEDYGDSPEPLDEKDVYIHPYAYSYEDYLYYWGF